MKILVIGSGGREHALVWKLAQSPLVKKIYCIPGSDGMMEAEPVTGSLEDTRALVNFALQNTIDLTIVGPELPLSLGVVDAFEKEGLKIFGPRKNAAILEFSKSFSKQFCERHHIPTAPFKIFTTTEGAKSHLSDQNQYPAVIKADGLAAGKGVVIAKDQAEAFLAVEEMIIREKFGEAGKQIIIEDFMLGVEATLMIATDGRDYVLFESCQDHKRIGDGDTGPNTGGMGAYSPAPVVTPEVQKKIEERIIRPLLAGMLGEDRPYSGILYLGLMIDKGEPSVVEFNCRFGDPEAQAILFRLKTDLVQLIEACLEGRLKELKVEFKPQTSVCVVMSAAGYPGHYEQGSPIHGLGNLKKMSNVFVFHAGTKAKAGRYYTHGGRVLGVTALGDDLPSAIQKAYRAVGEISWDGAYYRKDIGIKGLKGGL